MAKPELEFFPLTDAPYTPCAGNVAGLTERIVASDPESGTASRVLHFDPGTDTTPNGVLTHTFWEEVFIVQGSFTDLRLNQTFSSGEYACRPPGMEHGPWIAGPEGCTTYEVRYPDAGAAS